MLNPNPGNLDEQDPEYDVEDLPSSEENDTFED
jgi:hypothetical protein